MGWMDAFVNRIPFGTRWKWKGALRRTDGTELWYKGLVIARWDAPIEKRYNNCLILIKFRLSHLDFSYQTLHAITRTHDELGIFIQEHSGYTLEWENYIPYEHS